MHELVQERSDDIDPGVIRFPTMEKGMDLALDAMAEVLGRR